MPVLHDPTRQRQGSGSSHPSLAPVPRVPWLEYVSPKKKYREPDSIEIQASLVSNESFVNNACTKKMLVVHNYSL